MEISNQSLTSNVTIVSSPSATDLSVTVVTLTLGFWTMISNGSLLWFSIFNQNLRKEKRYLRLALFASDFIYGLGQTVICTERLRIFYINSWYTAYYCLSLSMGTFIGDILSLTTVCCMAVERLVAISWPIFYRNTNKKAFSLCLIFASITIAAISSIFQYYGVDNNKKPVACEGSAARLPKLKPFLSYFNCTLGCAIAALYAFVIIVMLLKNKKLSMHRNIPSTNRIAESDLRREIKAAKIVTVVVVTNFLFLILPNIVLTVVTAQGILTTSNIGQFVAIFAVCNSSVNALLYFFMDKSIRKLFTRNVNQVQTVSGLEASHMYANKYRSNLNETPMEQLK